MNSVTDIIADLIRLSPAACRTCRGVSSITRQIADAESNGPVPDYRTQGHALSTALR